jgi:hypothetical protein
MFRINMKIQFACCIAGLIAATAFAQDEDPAEILDGIRANWDVARLAAWINDGSSDTTVVGDKIEFRFRADVVGYIGIVYIDSSGSAAIIIPSENDEPALIQSHTDLVYPSEAAGFQFRAIAPAGTERAYLILSDRPIRPSQVGNADDFGFIELDDPASVLNRYVELVNEVSEPGLVAIAKLQHMTISPIGAPENVTVASTVTGSEDTPPQLPDDSGVLAGDVSTSTSQSSSEMQSDQDTGAIADVPAKASNNQSGVDEAEAVNAAGVPEPRHEVDPGDIGEVAELPDIPQSPDLPELPDTPGIEDFVDIPDVPETPGIEDVVDIPDVPDTPGIEDVVDIPDVPDTPVIEDFVDIPDVPDTPGIEDVVDIPDVPDTPDIEDVINIPDVPDIPKTPTTGNVLGRVLADPKTLSGGPSKIAASAGDAATVVAVNKLFGLVTGSSGRSPSANRDDEPRGVNDLVRKLESDPDSLDSLAEENPGAIGAIRKLARSRDPDRELANTLLQLNAEIDEIIEVYYCTSTSDCEVASIGQDQCNNPVEYKAYAAKTTDVTALQVKIKNYNSYDTVRRFAEFEQDAELICPGHSQPAVRCERNICESGE